MDGGMETGRGEAIWAGNARVSPSRFKVPERLCGGAHPQTARIKGGDRVSHSVSRSVLEREISLSQSVCRHDAVDVKGLREPPSFVAAKDERFVLENGPPGAEASAIVLLLCLLHFRPIIGPGFRVQVVFLVEPVPAPVILVPARLAVEPQFPTGSAPKRSVRFCRGHAKFFPPPPSNRDNRHIPAATAETVVRDVDSIQDDCILIAASAGDGSTAVPKPDLAAVIGGRARLQREQFGSVTL